jgi:hypothetical protein
MKAPIEYQRKMKAIHPDITQEEIEHNFLIKTRLDNDKTMKVGDKVKVTGLVVPKEWECGGVITELLPADGSWGATAIVCFPNGEEVEYELTDLEVK